MIIEHTEQRLMTWKDAAEFCGLPVSYLKNVVRGGHGPVAIRPSAKATFFRLSDLKEWMATWKVGK